MQTHHATKAKLPCHFKRLKVICSRWFKKAVIFREYVQYPFGRLQLRLPVYCESNKVSAFYGNQFVLFPSLFHFTLFSALILIEVLILSVQFGMHKRPWILRV